MKLILSKPTTFFTTLPVKITDEKKNIFYINDNPRKNLTFNLPRGTYYSSVNVYRVADFKPYPYIALPKYEHFFDSNNFDVRIEDNPNKGTFKPYDEFISIDKGIATHPFKPLRICVLAHEKGHSFFANENYCDWFAINWMLKNGFNPAQILLGFKLLFVDSPDRLQFVKDTLSKLNYLR